MSFFFSSGNFNVIPDSGVLYFPLNDSSTPSTAIEKWNGYDASITGATYVSDHPTDGSTSLDFDGNGDYAEVDNPSGVGSGLSNFSFASWIKPDTDNYTNIFGRERSGGSGSDVWSIMVQRGEQYVRVTNDSGSAVEAGEPIITDTWSHVVGTFDGSTLRYYRDGTQRDSTSLSGVLQNVSSSTAPTSMGTFSTESDFLYNGTLSESKAYAKTLTSTEVSNLYNTGSI